LIKNAEMVVTDSGGMLQEAHFAQTPYVFVMDIDRVLIVSNIFRKFLFPLGGRQLPDQRLRL